MIASGSRIGWQTTLADLALILFMVTAAAIADRPEPAPDPAEAAAPGVPAKGEPLAIYRDGPGAPPLAEWLASQPHDGRQNLTIVARHRPGGAAAAARRALALERAAAATGRSTRIVVEPADRDDLVAMLDFDGRRTPSAASGMYIAGTPASNTGTAPAATDER